MSIISSFKKYIKHKLGIESLQNQITSLQKQNISFKTKIDSLKTSQKQFESTNLELQKEINRQALLIADILKNLNRLESDLKYTKSKFQTDFNIQYNNIMRKVYAYMDESKYPVALSDWYFEKMGKTLNLDSPTSYNEKIQWLKLYDSTPEKTRLADKYLVREYVTDKIGEKYLIPLLGVWDSFDEIDFSSLPTQFVLKTNHGSSYNIIVKDKHTFDIDDARNKFNTWLHTDFTYYNGFELHYKNIPRKIIAEKYLENGEDEIYDYKIFCFNGNPEFIILYIDSGKPTLKSNIYDTNWKQLDLTIANRPNFNGDHLKPKNLNKMLDFARILSNGFSHVRVDFYEISGKIYFGEMTFTPASGLMKWTPEIYDEIYGNLIKLPNKYTIQ